MALRKQSLADSPVSLTRQMSYGDIVAYLDARWHTEPIRSLERMEALCQALGKPADSIPAIIIAGTNGKSITAHFTARLLHEEGLKVGCLFAPHILCYNERLAINQTTISNKTFTDVANHVIAAAEDARIDAHAAELLTAMAFMFFKQEHVDVMILESHEGGSYNPVNVCHARVACITRVTPADAQRTEQDMCALADEMVGIVKQGTHLVAGDQSKACLQHLQNRTLERGGVWAMPVRKLACLTYPFEQLHGRCAALAERAAQLFMESAVSEHTLIVHDSLLVKKKGLRGRPRLERKRELELNPPRTIEQFWRETVNELPCRFHVLDKEKPSILVDTADNVDAFENLLLGIRLLHYQRPLQGLTLVVGAADNRLNNEQFLRDIRYFFKKTPGQIFLCPITQPVPGTYEERSWNPDALANDLKLMKVKARAFSSFAEAFDAAKKSVDERYGLVVVCGSPSLVHEYWQAKGIKKLAA